VSARVIVYDCEIQNPIKDPNFHTQIGWTDYDKMGIGCVVTWCYVEKKFRFFDQRMMRELMAYLNEADLRVGWNSKSFDDPLLAANGCILRPDRHYDMKEEAQLATGNARRGGLKLDEVGLATVGKAKSKKSGAASPLLYQEGRFLEQAEGCMDDVANTRDIFTFVSKNGHLVSPVHGKITMPDPRGLMAIPS
jgi:hypothetical protein